MSLRAADTKRLKKREFWLAGEQFLGHFLAKKQPENDHYLLRIVG
jgi:hypothetical protein